MVSAHRRIHPDQTELIAGLELQFSHRRLRFDQAFGGSYPVQAGGRIGNEYFYFRFRHDAASLSVGKPHHPSVDAGRRKKEAQKLRRKQRRGTATWDDLMFSGRLGAGLDRHPSRVRLYASVFPVTGEEHAGDLEPEAAAQLFTKLLGELKPVPPRLHPRLLRRALRGVRTAPMNHRRGIIRKNKK